MIDSHAWVMMLLPVAADEEHVEPDEREQATLAEIRTLRAQGASLRGIAAALNHKAFRTRRGTVWRLESVTRILKPGVNAAR